MKPVFVHGLWSDANVWNSVMLELKNRGIESLAVQLALQDFEDDVEMLQRYVQADAADSHVLVGWSYGGAVITAAASNLDSVRSLGYVAAFIPDKGESVKDWSGRRPAAALGASLRITEDGYTYIIPNNYVDLMAPTGNETNTSILGHTQKMAHAGVMDAQLSSAAWRKIPSSYLLVEDDIVLDPKTQSEMATRADSEVEYASGGHAVMQTSPSAVSTFVQNMLTSSKKVH